jgi:uncharacterized phage-associated protein
MSYMKLVKLLYLADREALLRWGRPITTDRYVSMDHGPVVSNVYEIIRSEPQPQMGQFWRRFISEPDGNYDVSLLSSPAPSELSAAEELLLREIFTSHGGKTRWQLRDFCHTLPEWQDPEGGAIPIEYRDILQARGKTRAEIAAVEQDLDSLAVADALLAPA